MVNLEPFQRLGGTKRYSSFFRDEISNTRNPVCYPPDGGAEVGVQGPIRHYFIVAQCDVYLAPSPGRNLKIIYFFPMFSCIETSLTFIDVTVAPRLSSSTSIPAPLLRRKRRKDSLFFIDRQGPISA